MRIVPCNNYIVLNIKTVVNVDATMLIHMVPNKGRSSWLPARQDLETIMVPKKANEQSPHFFQENEERKREVRIDHINHGVLYSIHTCISKWSALETFLNPMFLIPMVLNKRMSLKCKSGSFVLMAIGLSLFFLFVIIKICKRNVKCERVVFNGCL